MCPPKKQGSYLLSSWLHPCTDNVCDLEYVLSTQSQSVYPISKLSPNMTCLLICHLLLGCWETSLPFSPQQKVIKNKRAGLELGERVGHWSSVIFLMQGCHVLACLASVSPTVEGDKSGAYPSPTLVSPHLHYAVIPGAPLLCLEGVSHWKSSKDRDPTSLNH